jgi:hypothetical protein
MAQQNVNEVSMKTICSDVRQDADGVRVIFSRPLEGLTYGLAELSDVQVA